MSSASKILVSVFVGMVALTGACYTLRETAHTKTDPSGTPVDCIEQYTPAEDTNTGPWIAYRSPDETFLVCLNGHRVHLPRNCYSRYVKSQSDLPLHLRGLNVSDYPVYYVESSDESSQRLIRCEDGLVVWHN